MSLPVSQYEELLAEVRGLRRKAQHVHRLAVPLLHSLRTSNLHPHLKDAAGTSSRQLKLNMDSLLHNDRQLHSKDYDRVASSEGTCSDDEGRPSSTHSASSEPLHDATKGASSLYNKTWPGEPAMWVSEPGNAHLPHCSRNEMTSVMSFASSSGGAPLDRVFSSPTERAEKSSQQLEAKVDMVYSLLAMLGGQEHADMGETLLALSTNPESCLAMRQSGCIPLLVQLAESDRDPDGRTRASQALNNLVHSNPDEKTRKREVRVLKLLQQVRAYVLVLQGNTDVDSELLPPAEDGDVHPVQTMAHLMKLSFDEGHRQAICQLGGIHSIAQLLENEHLSHGNTDEGHCVLLRRYSCMALTNLTFGDSGNKALLCSCKEFMKALIIQLQNPCDDLRQVTASVLRNLSWRADSSSKQTLREVGAVNGLMKAAMVNSKENTLKSILSALWNLSAHCTENKADICTIDGSLAFLVTMLTYSAPSKSLAIIENAGGILRNISSQIAVRDDYREILRRSNCLQILLEQLKSPSLTIVSNACGTLWNLSAKNEQDQEMLWQLGAPAMLRSLNHSKHKMIAMGSSAALKNLISSRPSHNLLPPMDSTAKAMDLPALPTLGARKQKALMQELDVNLAETCDNIDSPTKVVREDKFFVEEDAVATGAHEKNHLKTSKKSQVFRSESQECVPRPKIVFEARTSRSDTSLRAHTSLNLTDSLGKLRAGSSFLKTKSDINNETTSEKDHCSLDDIEIDLDVTECVESEEATGRLKPDISMEDIIERIQGLPTKTEMEFLTDVHTEISIEELKLAESESDTAPLKPTNQEVVKEVEITSAGGAVASTQIRNKPVRSTSRPIGSGIPLPKSIRQTTPPKSTVAVKPFSRSSSSTDHKNELNDAADGESSLNSSGPCDAEKLQLKPIENDDIEKVVEKIAESPILCANTTKPIGVATKHFISNLSSGAKNEDETEKIAFEPWTDGEAMNGANKEGNDDDVICANKSSGDINGDGDNCETTFTLQKEVDNRMLDPDAMIESLDRFTAELVSQAEAAHSNKETQKVTGSITEVGGDTWNEDTSPNDVSFPSISGSAPNVVTFSDEPVARAAVATTAEPQSNDFSSLNTTSSTMTESTLIAVEATKLAAVLKNEADMIHSMTSVQSLELDNVQPPSHLDSLTSSMTFELPRSARASPKLPRRKKSLQTGLLARRVLTNSLNHGSSLESVENNSLSNLDQLNPPSIMGEVLDLIDMQASMTSVASLPSEGNFAFKPPFSHQLTELETINPPSLFNEITDLCSSLADVPTDAICSEVYEDCITHVQTEDDVTLFSDAQSVTPVQSDFGSSSNESSPKKFKSITRGMTPKQKRKLAQERYKTYTVAAEMITSGDFSTATDDFKTLEVDSVYETINDSQLTESTPKDIPKDSPSRTTPKQRRKNNPERFQTQVLDRATTLELKRQFSTPESSPRVNRRVTDRARFQTRTISESSLSPDISSASNDFQFLQHEANRVLRKLQEDKQQQLPADELLDCETLSLVSNDEDLEGGGGSINYRTYTKNCGYKGNSLTRIRALVQASVFPMSPERRVQRPAQTPPTTPAEDEQPEADSGNAVEGRSGGKPKIVIPHRGALDEGEKEQEEEVKAVRGRRKPLYTKTNIVNIRNTNNVSKPIRNITSNLVKNVTSTFKSGSVLRNVTGRRTPKAEEEPVKQREARNMRPPTGYGARASPSSPKQKVGVARTATMTARTTTTTTISPRQSQPTTPKQLQTKGSPPLERQGTFTKDETTTTKSRIPTKPPSRIARAISQTNTSMGRTVSRVQSAVNGTGHFFGRSSSADSSYKRTSSSSSSSPSLKAGGGGAVKRSPTNEMKTQRSTSNTSIASTGVTPASTKKQVTSKIASLWKKVEEQKKQPPKKDSRVWIQPKTEPDSPRLLRSDTFESKEGVVLRKQPIIDDQTDPTKRISRLGSFIVMDETAGQGQSDYQQCEVVT